MLYQLKLSRPFSRENSPFGDAEYAFFVFRRKTKARQVTAVFCFTLSQLLTKSLPVVMGMALMAESPFNNPFREALRLGLKGAKSNLLPGGVLWILGLILIVSYYQVEAVAETFDQVGQWKNSFTPWFAMLSTAIFGSLVPWLVQATLLPKDRRQPFRQVPWLFLFWALHGWLVDAFYFLQSRLFGTQIDASTILVKTLVDQLVWAPFIAVPQVLLSYLFIENELSPSRFRAALASKGFLARAIPLVLANWVVWFPAVALIYLFPLPLQLPLQNLILALWCLIVSFFAKNA